MTTHLTHAVLVTPDTIGPPRGAPNRAEIQRAAFLARYRNDSTRNGYAITLDQWFAWCDEIGGIDPLDAERGHVELFLRVLEKAGRKPATIGNKLTALVGFYRYAFIDGAITANPMAEVQRPKVERRSTRDALTRFEMARVLEVAEQDFPLQTFALIAFLAESGVRISEACGIDVADIDSQRGQMTVAITRKGSKRRVLQLSGETGYAISEHLERAGRDAGPVFTTKTGLRLDRRAAGRIVTRVVRKAGITGKKITPHSFRHSWCTMARDAQMDPRAIQAAGGWADPRMMDYYDSARDDVRLSGIVANGVTAWIRAAA